MKLKQYGFLCLAGLCAGCINGLFGAGGGMVLVPLLGLTQCFSEQEVFSVSVAIILPICLTSLLCAMTGTALPWELAWPYLAGGALGGIAAGLWGHRISSVYLHRLFGALILWGGIRYLC